MYNVHSDGSGPQKLRIRVFYWKKASVTHHYNYMGQTVYFNLRQISVKTWIEVLNIFILSSCINGTFPLKKCYVMHRGLGTGGRGGPGPPRIGDLFSKNLKNRRFSFFSIIQAPLGKNRSWAPANTFLHTYLIFVGLWHDKMIWNTSFKTVFKGHS